ncbi:MAG TPA: thioredoxin domain-containing protein [Calditrichaeota bacterium]|nr:thioredoxin domain-containing protein [Calditrichota bacterium]
MKIFLILLTMLVLSCDGQADQKKEKNMPKHSNRLSQVTSPYLQQHAHNPVDWYPWGEEAFAKARAENKPILLSIGYAACHWCHVMEKESFENEEIAALMNSLFVNIKVDREERPDVDQLYMRYVQLLTGSGGWPMTVFLTPQLKPFYGGTYFPPENRYGRPGFRRLLQLISDYYHNQKDDLNKNLKKIEMAITASFSEINGQKLPDRNTFNQACKRLAEMYEPEYGGLGNAPKFPAVQAFNLFLRKYANDGEQRYLDMVTHTLKSMGKGGVYDQLGSGFARYSTDNSWLVPHFEKMLYDNAQIVQLYLDTYLITKDEFYLQIVKEILAFVMREMTDPEGGFYSSFDADSEGEEGKFYIWDKKEIIQILGEENGEIFCAYYGVTEQGNFEGKNILNVVTDIPTLAVRFKTDEEVVQGSIADSKEKLFQIRKNRIPPALDDKILLSWNALMHSAFAKAYQVLGDKAYETVIRHNIAFIQKKMVRDNTLFHTYKDGIAKQNAFLDDYAYLIQALLDAYEALYEPSWLRWADELTRQANGIFWDENNGGYYYTSADEQLLHRIKDENDQSIPSATGVMLMNMLRLYSVNENSDYITRTEALFKKYEPVFVKNPYGYASYLNALDFYLNKPKEILLVQGKRTAVQPMLKAIFTEFIPNKVVLVINLEGGNEAIQSSVFQDRNTVNDMTTAYVCHNFICSMPVTNAATLRQLIKKNNKFTIFPTTLIIFAQLFCVKVEDKQKY